MMKTRKRNKTRERASEDQVETRRHTTTLYLILFVVSVVLGLLLAPKVHFPLLDSQPLELPQELMITSQMIVSQHPHDRQAFTQGLIFDSGHILESTGRYGQTSLRQVAIPSGKLEHQYQFTDMRVFGEGITLSPSHDVIVMLSYESKRGFVFDYPGLTLVKEFQYDTTTGQGWVGWVLR